jgi:lysophospholipase L1-like esterase
MGLLDPPALSLAAARTTYRPRAGGETAALGDSLTQGSTNQGSYDMGMSYFGIACALSGQRIKERRNAGISGQRTDQILARVDADVIAYAPSRCWVMAGTNDIIQSVALATAQGYYRQIVTKLIAARIEPVICLVPPNNNSTLRLPINRWNAWLVRYAESLGLDVIDFYTPLVKPSNGAYLDAYYADGVHPNTAGVMKMAQVAVEAMAPRYPAGGAKLYTLANWQYGAGSGSIDGNLIPNSLFLEITSGMPDVWTTAGGAGTTTIDSSDTTIKGNWLDTVASGSTERASKHNAFATGFSVGNEIEITGLFAGSVEAASGQYSIECQATSAGGTNIIGRFRPVGAWSRDIAKSAKATYRMRFTVPTGTTALQLLASAKNGTVSLAQPGITNLTALGILTP